ncbi:plastid transcriptionally active7 [Actinidia rufa]|uniref:Plastid transcriptionally active7 n=1 Tax=Actinidia rufa TaxID=165716 RepID=A0A7J0EC58_9ERIC|nr:plastid transcriptionally active7 [Actinidia rufa]
MIGRWLMGKMYIDIVEVLCAHQEIFLVFQEKDDPLQYKTERVPFLEEQVRKIREGGKLLTMDIERLLLSEDNRFDFVNGVAAEAKQYVEKNRDDYGAKKAIFHVLSNRSDERCGVLSPRGIY